MEQRLAGGNAGGAVLVDGPLPSQRSVRRATGPWTPSVHALPHHLQARSFARVVDGLDRALAELRHDRRALCW